MIRRPPRSTPFNNRRQRQMCKETGLSEVTRAAPLNKSRELELGMVLTPGLGLGGRSPQGFVWSFALLLRGTPSPRQGRVGWGDAIGPGESCDLRAPESRLGGAWLAHRGPCIPITLRILSALLPICPQNQTRLSLIHI